jgi:N6-adenosine-specific RNA methylase IME4
LVENFHEVEGAGKTRDRIGAFAGVSGRTVEKIRDIIDAAAADPVRFGPLVEEMDRTRHSNTPYRRLRKMLDEERVLGLEPTPGRFKTLVIDPPWTFEIEGSRGAPYATMSHEQILALGSQVQSWTEDDGHLYLWATNAHLPAAFDLMRAWGFDYKTLLTWKKPAYKLGSYFRNQTEHVVFGVRGHLPTRPAAWSLSNCFEAPAGDHSEKPEVFYNLVVAASYPPYGEGFQRKPRQGFINLFREREAAE